MPQLRLVAGELGDRVHRLFADALADELVSCLTSAERGRCCAAMSGCRQIAASSTAARRREASAQRRFTAAQQRPRSALVKHASNPSASASPKRRWTQSPSSPATRRSTRNQNLTLKHN